MEHPERLIDALHLEDLRNGEHPSIFDENEGYDMLIVRLPLIVDEMLRPRSLGFIITPENGYYYDRETARFITLEDRFEAPHRMVDTEADRLLKAFDVYKERIAEMEEDLYADRPGERFLADWMGLKRDILRIERVLARTVDTLGDVIGKYENEPAFPVNHYADLHEHVERIVRSAVHQLSKLDYLYNFYNVRTNEKMNRMIYLLTIISAVFLPLNLVVGFFGMNTGGLPFSDTASGTVNAMALMGSLMVLTAAVVLLWRRKVER